MPTINQQVIAEKLKLSRATVSRCFTNHPGINPRTRAKVFALAARMGYTHPEKREPAAHRREDRRLAFGVLIGVDLPNFDHTGYANPGQELLNGLSEVARVHDVRLDLHFVRPENLHLDSPSYAKIMAGRQRWWDGVVLIDPFPISVVDELVAKYPVFSLVEPYASTPPSTASMSITIAVSINSSPVCMRSGIAVSDFSLGATRSRPVGRCVATGRLCNAAPRWACLRAPPI